MAQNRRGNQTVVFSRPPSLLATCAVGGKRELEGPLHGWFDLLSRDTKFGQDSWEKAETQMQTLALQMLLQKADLEQGDVDLIFGGDLLNQCIGTSFCLRDFGIPFLGIYGACSNMAEGLALASMAVNGGYASAERQYRFPLVYGGQRTPTSQWTVTGSGCVLVASEGPGPYVTSATIGKITDWGVKDANNMGAAMAPAAYRTIAQHLRDRDMHPGDYDLIVTGDLGSVGKQIVLDLFARDGVNLDGVYDDCGTMIYDLEHQDVQAGGSGCGCSAVVLSGYLYQQLKRGKYHRILLCGTGALLSTTSTQQGESIPGISHAVSIETEVRS